MTKGFDAAWRDFRTKAQEHEHEHDLSRAGGEVLIPTASYRIDGWS